MRAELDFYAAGAAVKRYHTLTTLQSETVGHHSHGVAVLLGLMVPEASAALLRAALLHDLAEHVTGDIPSPAKRLYNIGEQVNSVEQALLAGAGLNMPELSGTEARQLKLADIAQGALFCAREVALGNYGMRAVFRRYLSYAQELEPQGRELELFEAITGYYYEHC